MRILACLCLMWVAAMSDAADSPAPARLSRELSDYLRRPEAQVRVLDGALLICKQAHPKLDVDAERKAFTALAAELNTTLAGAATARQQAEALAQFLFVQKQFGLPERDDAAAFLLTDVLQNKRGNCLGLSVLCLTLAEETHLKLYGVPVPSRSSDAGHMLVRFDDGTTRRNFDPAQKGMEHADAYYQREFKLTENDMRSGYVLGNAKRREVLALLLINLGGACVEDQRAAEALPLLDAALAIRPESAGAQSNLAAAKSLLGDVAGAEKAYAAALRIDPNYFPARIGQADLALRKGDPNASKMVDGVLAIEPENVQARTMLASLQLRRNDLIGALKTLNELAALPTADTSVWSNLGRCYALSGDMALSETSYRRALVYDDRSADAHCGLARALIVNGRRPEAVTEFEAALKIDATYAAAKSGLAELAASAPKSDDAPKKAATVAPPPERPRGTTVLPFTIVANRIFVTVRINDAADVQAIVDTGAEVSLLNSARVKLPALKPAGAENLLGSMVGRIATQTVIMDSLTLGGTMFKNQTVLRIDQGPGSQFELIDFVLGMDVLGKTRFTLDFDRSELVLWPAGSKPLAPGAGVERVQMTLTPPPGAHATRPYAVATLNQKNAATFLIDSGADTAMIVVYKKPAELGYAISEPPAAMARVFDSNIKQDLPVYLTVFDTLDFGKASFKNVEGRIVDASSVFGPVARSGLVQMNVIGTPFFKTLLALHIDMQNKTVAFDRAKTTP